MHLFEALLALYAIAKKDEYRMRLEEILSLFEGRFFQVATGILCEHFSTDLLPVEGDRGVYLNQVIIMNGSGSLICIAICWVVLCLPVPMH
jgi:hypothetical protein